MLSYFASEMKVTIDETRGAVVSLCQNGEELIRGDEKLPLFNIQFRDDSGKAFQTDTYATVLEAMQSDETSCVLTYRGTDYTGLAVRVYISAEDMIRWRIEILNETGLTPEWVDFPQFTVPNDLKGAGGESQILWGFNEGTIVDDISFRTNGGAFRYREPSYPGEGAYGLFPAIVETQFMAYYNERRGLYIGTHDVSGALKGIDFYQIGDEIKLQYRLYTSAELHGNFIMDYDFVMAAFHGDWHDAAEIYRRWFEENKPDEFVKIPENTLLPQWYSESPLVIAYPVRGWHDTDPDMSPNKLFPYTNAVSHIERIAKKTNAKIMALLMHWEGTAPWAPPYVWPPMGGTDELRKYIDELHKRGHLIGVYCSGLGWTQQSNMIKEYNKEEQFRKEHLEKVMCISPEGELPLSHICTAQRSGYDMCPTQEFTVNTIVSEVEKIVDGGVDYIQVLDQNHGGTSYFCYSREHGHPPVPGKWQTEAMRVLLKKLEECTHRNGKKVLIGCESAAAETYLPYLLFSDNRFNLIYMMGAYAVPAYQYVYHQYLNNFMGNQVCAQQAFDHKKYPDNLLIRLAYSYTAGEHLTLVMNPDGDLYQNWCSTDLVPDEEAVFTFIRNAYRQRTGAAKKYLHTGKMIKPYALRMPKPNVVMMKCGYRCVFDKLMYSCWEAEDGTIGEIVVNYNKEPVKFSVETEKELLVDGAACEGGCEFEIAPLDVMLIELR